MCLLSPSLLDREDWTLVSLVTRGTLHVNHKVLAGRAGLLLARSDRQVQLLGSQAVRQHRGSVPLVLVHAFSS